MSSDPLTSVELLHHCFSHLVTSQPRTGLNAFNLVSQVSTVWRDVMRGSVATLWRLVFVSEWATQTGTSVDIHCIADTVRHAATFLECCQLIFSGASKNALIFPTSIDPEDLPSPHLMLDEHDPRKVQWTADLGGNRSIRANSAFPAAIAGSPSPCTDTEFLPLVTVRATREVQEGPAPCEVMLHRVGSNPSPDP